MSTHKTRVEAERGRVVCLACPWFKYEAGATADQLRAMGRLHTRATEER